MSDKKYNPSKEEIEDAIIGAMEGGSSYWAGLNNRPDIWRLREKGTPLSEYAIKLLTEGDKVLFYDIENPSDEWELTMDKLKEGFNLAIKQNYYDPKVDDIDSEIADMILQLSLFGEIVFG